MLVFRERKRREQLPDSPSELRVGKPNSGEGRTPGGSAQLLPRKAYVKGDLPCFQERNELVALARSCIGRQNHLMRTPIAERDTHRVGPCDERSRTRTEPDQIEQCAHDSVPW